MDKEPEVLETFQGYVDSISDGMAYVTLESQLNGDVLYGEYPASKMADLGIGEQDRFLCETLEIAGGTTIRLTLIPPRELTAEEIREIREKIERILPNEDPGLDY